jgi:serine/threonine protein kinase
MYRTCCLLCLLSVLSAVCSVCCLLSAAAEYLSPEVLDRQGHGTAVDWWNLGMVTYEMLTGLPPWYTTDKQKLFDRLRNAPLKFPYYVSKPAASFIHGLLQRNPEVRLGSKGGEEVRRHRFFHDIDWTALLNREITPPFNPCRQHDGDADTDNFEKEFTLMPVNSVETASASRQALLAEGLSNSESSDTFSNFTYQEDSYLDHAASPSSSSSMSSEMTISPLPSPRDHK